MAVVIKDMDGFLAQSDENGKAKPLFEALTTKVVVELKIGCCSRKNPEDFVEVSLGIESYKATPPDVLRASVDRIEDRSQQVQTDVLLHSKSTQTSLPHKKNSWTQWEAGTLTEEELEEILESFNLRYAIRKCSARIEKALVETTHFSCYTTDWDNLLHSNC